MKVISSWAEDTHSSSSPQSREITDLWSSCLVKQQEPKHLASLHK